MIRKRLQATARLYLRDFKYLSFLLVMIWVPYYAIYFLFRLGIFEKPYFAEGIDLAIFVEFLITPFASAIVLLILQSRNRQSALKVQRILLRAIAIWPRLFINQLFVALYILAGLLAFIVPGIYLGVRLALVSPTVVFERKPLFGNFSRSFDLTRNNQQEVLLAGGTLFVFVMGIWGLILWASFGPISKTSDWFFIAFMVTAMTVVKAAMIAVDILLFEFYENFSSADARKNLEADDLIISGEDP